MEKIGLEISIYESINGGHYGYFTDYKNICSQGETVQEVRDNLKDALKTVLQSKPLETLPKEESKQYCKRCGQDSNNHIKEKCNRGVERRVFRMG